MPLYEKWKGVGDKIKSLVEGILEDGTAVFKQVSFGELVEVSKYPAVLIIPREDTISDDAIGLLGHRLLFALRVFVREKDPEKGVWDLLKRVGSVFETLKGNRNLDGLVEDTYFSLVEVLSDLPKPHLHGADLVITCYVKLE